MGTTYLIQPHVGVGPIRFGMTRGEVAKALGTIPEELQRTPEAKQTEDVFEDQQIFASYDVDGRVVLVQFGDPAALVFPPDVSLRMPFADLLSWAEESGFPFLCPEDGDVHFSRGLGLSAYSDAPEEQWLHVRASAIGVFAPGYWDS